ncbi:type II toxin-antitoxin system death-on-curing family toxin [Demequina sp. NBRC 110056]|uniref:type II toxin-antitoxin system death-on-curing family toxin n=1 Tax=Demequina sp. NBRC 110056 TaxID=1570345 RepID=UPI000A059F91|nr:type II toxin-antitoxin system death-on-curing family toxin [Demequina sp. NBRC 110056]
MTTRFLTLEHLLDLCRDLGVGPVRDVGQLDACAQRPQTTLMGVDAYPAVEQKAAALLHSVVANHPLGDGNKRLGWHSLTVFLAINGLDVALTHDEAFELTMAVADGSLRDVDAIAARLRTEPRL